jgi:hypothetical protein
VRWQGARIYGRYEWVDALIEAGHDVDILIAECYTYDRKTRFHLDYASLKDNLPRIGAKRVILTHMSPEMIARATTIDEFETGFDGFEICARLTGLEGWEANVSYYRWSRISALGQKRRLDSRQVASGLPRSTDVVGAVRHFAVGPRHKVAALQPAAREQEPRGR